MNDPLELIDGYLEGTLSEAEGEALRRWLDEDREHLATFLRRTNLHCALRSTFLGQREAQQYADLATPRGTRGRKPRFFARLAPTPFSITVATIVMGVVLTAMYFMAPPVYRAWVRRHETHETAMSRTLVARVAGAHRAVWAAGATPAATGELLAQGRTLRLQAGLLQITYGNGVQVLLEGPADFTIATPESGYLQQGKLRATVAASQAKGFVVETPLGDVVDLGTEFGVDAQPTATLVHVYQGRVALRRRATADTSTVLQRGESGVISSDSVALNPDFKPNFARGLPAASGAEGLIADVITSRDVDYFAPSDDDLVNAGSRSLLAATPIDFELDQPALAFDYIHDGKTAASTLSGTFENENSARVPSQSSWTAEFQLDTTTSAQGYDIERIETISSWHDQRAGHSVIISYNTVAQPQFERLGVFTTGLIDGGSGSVRILRKAGPIASGVKTIRLQFFRTSGTKLSPIIQEVDVVGTPTK